MYDHAVEWVRNHQANCTSETCGCSTADPEVMVSALIEQWLELPIHGDN
jgi:hypothetical protein